MDALDHGRQWIHRWVKDYNQWEKVIQAYAASVTFSDAMVGRLLDTFEKSDYANNTIVVLWSDHGMHMGEKENIEKFTLWEKSTWVPLIISVPGLTQKGSKCEQPVSLMDLYPSLADLAGFEKPSHLDGKSLLPQIKNPTTPTSPVLSSYRFTWREEPITGHAVRSFRLIQMAMSSGMMVSDLQLFNVSNVRIPDVVEDKQSHNYLDFRILTLIPYI